VSALYWFVGGAGGLFLLIWTGSFINSVLDFTRLNPWQRLFRFRPTTTERRLVQLMGRRGLVVWEAADYLKLKWGMDLRNWIESDFWRGRRIRRLEKRIERRKDRRNWRGKVSETHEQLARALTKESWVPPPPPPPPDPQKPPPGPPDRSRPPGKPRYPRTIPGQGVPRPDERA